jgi:hypothetical protein
VSLIDLRLEHLHASPAWLVGLFQLGMRLKFMAQMICAAVTNRGSAITLTRHQRYIAEGARFSQFAGKTRFPRITLIRIVGVPQAGPSRGSSEDLVIPVRITDVFSELYSSALSENAVTRDLKARAFARSRRPGDKALSLRAVQRFTIADMFASAVHR